MTGFPYLRSAARRVKIGVARDRAFCFYYEDNFRLLADLGAEPVFFSPLADSGLPEGISGLILGGGYPEEHLAQLSENRSMADSIKKAVQSGMPGLRRMRRIYVPGRKPSSEKAGYIRLPAQSAVILI